MNIKKTLSFALMSLAALSLSAAQKSNNTPFTAYGENWIEIDAGANVYSMDTFLGSDSEAGAALAIKGNLHLIEVVRFGIDFGYSLAFDDLSYNNNSVKLNATSYAAGMDAKLYVTAIQKKDFGLTVFLTPFTSYTYIDTEASYESISILDASEDYFSYGAKIGAEVSFLKDFYITPAYRYQRLEAFNSSIEGINVSSIEVEFAWRMYEGLSLHLNYAHILESEYSEEVDISTDKVSVGVRYTF